MLFSEPKIPQSNDRRRTADRRSAFQCSSASRKFLNSRSASRSGCASRNVSVLFSEPKIPQSTDNQPAGGAGVTSFSALQRAENSSITMARVCIRISLTFQCSSASRKFLNSALLGDAIHAHLGFSALQRAENSSMAIIRSIEIDLCL